MKGKKQGLKYQLNRQTWPSLPNPPTTHIPSKSGSWYEDVMIVAKFQGHCPQNVYQGFWYEF